MNTLYRVVYCSRNVLPEEPGAMVANVRAILDISRRNNTRDDITGALLFSQGCFAQVLEGPQDAVETAFERIQCDERHSEVTVLSAGPIVWRDFPDWSMAFSGTLSAHNPLHELDLQRAFTAHTDAADQVMTLIRSVVSRECEWLAAA